MPAAKSAADTGAAVLAGHHTTKAGQIAGSNAVAGSVRQVLMVERDSADIASDQAPGGRLRRAAAARAVEQLDQVHATLAASGS